MMKRMSQVTRRVHDVLNYESIEKMPHTLEYIGIFGFKGT